jgi:hypothetical protein
MLDQYIVMARFAESRRPEEIARFVLTLGATPTDSNSSPRAQSRIFSGVQTLKVMPSSGSASSRTWILELI